MNGLYYGKIWNKKFYVNKTLENKTEENKGREDNMAINVNQYQFNRICSQMGKDFGVIRKGEEENHTMMFFPMEGNLLKIYRANPSSNSRRLSEAIPLALFQIKSYLTGEEFDLSSFKSVDNERLVHAMLMTFDPFTNEEIKEMIEHEKIIDLTDQNQLKDFYQEPIMCMLRIRESVDTWEKQRGMDGYFSFMEEYMGNLIPQEEELKYTICLGENHRETI